MLITVILGITAHIIPITVHQQDGSVPIRPPHPLPLSMRKHSWQQGLQPNQGRPLTLYFRPASCSSTLSCETSTFIKATFAPETLLSPIYKAVIMDGCEEHSCPP